ncbi:c-type cytochrome [Sunxiuqinia sp. A32]|uniref:c-type cytochrome n=1 Tax=Sunxiuqinia sp. A32 TaxID=3461496 RepID=UPI0040467175
MTNITILQLPVPKDINLPLPLPEGLLIGILIVSFLLHILFINLMMGGTILTFWYQIKGLKNKEYDMFAREIASTITVNKSMAVVLGVAPLLSINVLYTVYFYSANALTGNMWISIVPWVAISFLLLYLHKYNWNRLENNKALHLTILAVPLLSFLFIPFIFLANINLMLFPERWHEMEGFITALSLPNVFPRYLHFVVASLAVTGLFMTAYFGRRAYKLPETFKKITKADLRKKSLNLALGATGSQLIFGPLLYLTLPSKGMSWSLFWVILGGALSALIGIYWMWRKMVKNEMGIDRKFWMIIASVVITILFMGTGRHIYRENALSTHKDLMAEKTKAHWENVEKAHQNLLVPKETLEAISSSPGQELFQSHCAVCHAANTRLVGPPMADLSPLYEGKQEDLNSWIKAPGRKRMDYPQMTGFPQLTDEQLSEISKFVLENDW